MRELKTATITIRTVHAVRDMAARLAKADQRSIANTIERLIRAEHDRLEAEAPEHHGHSRRYLEASR